ncbi:glycoside hydrolase [Trichodelitschia bisporula]|uniref:Glycoside hydrolase n=1 Tax=Trichodelitschia bisporula TaxID=703511 RepID=A0A6G1I1H5_9PEZI|nr:glycoside hydrolase [Trichodelitschia bisporula]
MAQLSPHSKPAWWKEVVVYQIYPASFNDTNGDGCGDVPGITAKLDYLKDLGVDVVWLSPIYKSPHVDMGYDISDYETIDPRYGSLDDVDTLIAELGKRDMKLIMDLVVNHTSDQHHWFLESRSSTTNPKRDWYIWKPPRYDADGTRRPPTNWAQILDNAESAWTYDEVTDSYFLSLFTPAQPDLNWENPAVRAAVHDVLRFWLKRGVSGFRMDVINLISKIQTYPDAPIKDPESTYQMADAFFAQGPRLREFLTDMRREVLDHFDTMTVGEMPFEPSDEDIISYVNGDTGPLNMIFPFDLVTIDGVPGASKFTPFSWDARHIGRVINRLQKLMFDGNGWNSVFCENHDNPRSVTRYTDDSDETRERGAKLLALMAVGQSGTLYIYQGQELGLRNFSADWPMEEYKDIESIKYWEWAKSTFANDPAKLEEMRLGLWAKARDNSRTPMQWDGSANAGFCPEGVTPWMRVNDDYQTVNAAAQVGRSDSVHAFWKQALKLRNQHEDLVLYGNFDLLERNSKEVVAWRRSMPGEEWVVVMNFSGKAVTWDLSGRGVEIAEWVLGNYDGYDREKAKSGLLLLLPWEGLIGTST